MKKIIAILASMSLLVTTTTSVVACSQPPEWADDHDLFHLEPRNQSLDLDENGNQIQPFIFSFHYLLHSPTTGDETDVKIASTTVATTREDEASDDSYRNGKFFKVEKVPEGLQELDEDDEDELDEDEETIDYQLQFDSERISEWGNREFKDFHLTVHFEGTYFNDETLDVTLDFYFDLTNQYEFDEKEDLDNFIPEEQRDLGVIDQLNDLTPMEQAKNLIKTKLYSNYLTLASETTTTFNLPNKEVTLIAKSESREFIGEVTLKYAHGEVSGLLPDVSQGINLFTLNTDRLAFSKMSFAQKTELIKEILKEWYSATMGEDFYKKYFQYFEIHDQDLNVDSTTAFVTFNSPWSEVNREFLVYFQLPYTHMTDAIPEGLFAEQIVEMTPVTSDELVFKMLKTRANLQVPDFDEHFILKELDVVNETIRIEARNKPSNQIFPPNMDIQLRIHLGKRNLQDMIGAKLRNYAFDGTNNVITYYLTIKEIILSRIQNDMNTILTSDERALITLSNDWNKNVFDSTDPDTWNNIKVTPTPEASRYIRGEVNIRYVRPTRSGLDLPLSGTTYDTPGLNKTMQIDAPFLVSTQPQIRESFLRTLNQIYADNPFSKWVVINNPTKTIAVGRPDIVHDYLIYGASRIQAYLRPNTVWIGFRLGQLDLASFFVDDINVGQELDATTEAGIAQELLDMILGRKESDIQPYPSLNGAVQVTDVQINGQTGSAQLRVQTGYVYSSFVINRATINFRLK